MTHLHLLLLSLLALTPACLLAQSNAPTLLSGTAPAYNQVVLTWKDNSTGETKFEIERNNFASFTKIGEAAANATTYTDNTVGGGTYRVRAILATGAATGYSNEFTISTPPEPPTVPTSLAATAPSANTIHLTWTNPGAGTATDFLLERSTSSGGPFAQIAVVAYSRAPTYDDNGALSGTQYCYRVRARGTGGTSGYSNTACASTPNAPSNVKNLTAQATGSSSIKLSWTAFGKESGIDIERRTGQTGTWGKIASVLGENAQYTDNNLSPGTEYCYRISESGHDYSATACATTSAPPVTIPRLPSALAATAVSASQINLTWTDNAIDETGFEVERSTDGISFAKIADLGPNTTTYASTGLAASTHYFYRVRAVNSAGPSPYSNVADATTPAPPVVTPAAPARLVAVAVSPNQINLSWADVSTNETGFQVERSTDGTNFGKIADLGSNAQAYTDGGLTGNTRYCYRVRAVNTAGASDYTEVVCATTPAPPVPAPAAPAALVATAVSASQINLTWTDNAGNETGYELERSTDGVNFAKIADLPVNTTTYQHTGLTPATRYYYRVRAVNAGGGSGYSNTADATTPDVAPAAPARLTAQAISFSQINLNWADVSGNETGFELERSTDGTNFNKIADLGLNTTTYANTGLTGSTRYYYRIRAVNAIGASGYSNVADATTLAPPVPPPAAPTVLVAATASASQINLNWTDNATNETGYELERSTDGTNFMKIADLPANTTTYASTGLTPATRYYYRVRAVNSGGSSGYSNTADATTPDVAPAAPARLTAQATSYSAVSLTWADISGNETGFEIEQSTNGTTFSRVGTVNANVTSYQPIGLNGATTYYYRVRAVNAIGPSDYSNTATVTTPQAPLPSAPTNLTAVPVDFDLIKLTWSPVSANTTSVVIERSTSSTSGFMAIGQQVPPKTEFGDVGILPIATYYYRIKAVNSAGSSDYSNIAKVDASALIDGVEPKQHNLSVYAADQTLFLKTDRRAEATIRLFTVQGIAVFNKNATLDAGSASQYALHQLPAGVYIVAVQTAESIVTKKIMLP